MNTPVVLIAFNRPGCLRQVLGRVREARPQRLWIVADGARLDRPGESEKVAEVRQLAESSVDWPCEVRRVYAEQNMGCARRVSSGLDAVFAEEEQAIILEDDCVPDPTFFRFCAEVLERFRDEPRIATVAGDNFQGGATRRDVSCYFSRYPHCWGWATWRRAWSAYDYGMSVWPSLESQPAFRRGMSTAEEERYWRRAFRATKEGILDSWSHRWTLTCWAHSWLTVLPCVNLVSNIGFGQEATHTRDRHPVAALSVEPMRFPLRFPSVLAADATADARTARLLFHQPSVGRRLVRKLLASLGQRGAPCT